MVIALMRFVLIPCLWILILTSCSPPPGGSGGVTYSASCAGGCTVQKFNASNLLGRDCLAFNAKSNCSGGQCRAHLKTGLQCITGNKTECIRPDGGKGTQTCEGCYWGIDCVPPP